PQESALNESTHQEATDPSFWESAGNWVKERYTTDDGWNWGNVLGDAGLALGIAGMFACPVCGAAGAIGAGLSMGSGAWHMRQGNTGSAAWGLLAGVPLLGGVGVRFASVIRGSQAQGRWWSHITTNNGVIRNRKREHRRAESRLAEEEAAIATSASSASSALGHVGTNISIGGVVYNETEAFQFSGK
ncbi:hypothetical protein, partial [Nocardiopsis kunsanensis]|uniref:hypothetical protein n=1 Tax=Nocardiopsis kunsanensis TaxID=141693 RepID=UPI001E540791